MKAKSIKGKTPEEIQSALKKSMSDGFKPTLAIAFVSVQFSRAPLKQIMLGDGISLFGVTTNGEFIDEETEKGSACILLLDMDKDCFHLYFEPFVDKNYRSIARQIAAAAKERFETPAFLLGISHAAADGEAVLQGLQDVCGESVNAFGGAAGDDYAFRETFVFTQEYDSNEAIVCLAIDETRIQTKGIATCGWKAVGTERTVTRSEGNHVYTVDDIPALEITAKYGGLVDLRPDNQNLLVEIAANFPLQLQREKGDPVMRPGLVVDWSDKSFYTSGSVPQGSKVRFSLPPDWDVMEKVVKGVVQLKENEMPEADAVVVFSCAGRILSLGPLMIEEIEGIRKVWNVPMAGMFSNAELARATGGNLEMHNLTTCVVAFKEK